MLPACPGAAAISLAPPRALALLLALTACSNTPLNNTDARASSSTRAAAASPEPHAAAPRPPLAPTASAPATRGCRDRPGDAGDFSLELHIGGERRSALLHVPASHDPDEPTALMLTFHGSGSDGAGVAAISNMNASSDAHGFIAAYPDGADGDWNCCENTPHDDVAFVDALLRKLETEYCIDAQRIFASGFSNGGYMAYRLLCELSTRITAIAVLEAGLEVRDCRPTRPISVIQFHGTDDEAIPYAEAAQANQRARELNACFGIPTLAHARGEVRCELWSHCAPHSRVQLCTITGGGHQWAGGGAIRGLGHTTRDIDATERIVDFFGLQSSPP